MYIKFSIFKLSLLFFPNVDVTILLRNFNNTYSKDSLSFISKNYIQYLSKFLHFVHFKVSVA